MAYYGGSGENRRSSTNSVSKWDMRMDDSVNVRKNRQERTPVKKAPPKKGELELATFRKAPPAPAKARPVVRPEAYREAAPERYERRPERRTEPMETRIIKKPVPQYEVKKRAPLSESQKKTMKKAAFIMSAVFIVCILGVLVFQLMRVNEINVEGLKQLGAEYVISVSGIEKGGHIFALNESEAEKRINSDPRMEFQSVAYEFPDKVVINIKECVPAACFFADGKYVVIDMDGKVLGLTDDKPECAVVSGISALSFPVGQKISTDSEYMFDALKNLLAVFDEYGITADVTEINFESPYSISYLMYTGMNVKLGQKDSFNKKVYFAMKVIERLAEQGSTTGNIDVSYGNQAVYTKLYYSGGTQGNDKVLHYDLHDFEGGQDNAPGQSPDEPGQSPDEPSPSPEEPSPSD